MLFNKRGAKSTLAKLKTNILIAWQIYENRDQRNLVVILL